MCLKATEIAGETGEKSALYWIRTSDPYPVKVML
jgi:hypothetical protein